MILIRLLIISICVLYIIKSLARIFLPMLFQGLVNKAQQQQNQQQYREQQRPNGSIRVDYMPPAQKKSVPDSEGEFIDYEELK
ncbi:DUF4834 family protein [Mucilaginibacter sp. RS28]|uniref:DUF4834 family protein n=1 Tax=Mucilaginibacter straminoryzae TaxID=2932774 RepID=A0A9X1X5C7_9SPHI|nr:DUF4834 family protein [Mucilaginibacter straminoryzae]MCJ8210710.1 DUF4834 family protein [Mucilaginibacter straminoryzae]